MAKKTDTKTGGSKAMDFGELNDFLSKEVNPDGSMIEDNKHIGVKEWISTGIYALDLLISGRLLDGGIPNNRLTGFGGQSGCLFPTEKINIYVMKTKHEKHNVYDETSRNTSTL